MIVIPVTNQPNQTFQVPIPRETQNINLQFYFAWNDIAGYWMLSIFNLDTNTGMVQNVPIVTGTYPVFDIMRPYQYLDIGHCYLAKLSSVQRDAPNAEDWGTNFALIWD